MRELKNEVLAQKKAIIKLIDAAKKNYKIKITDHVCALQFREYAENVEVTGNSWRIDFTDASNVTVSVKDFIEYHLYYSEHAIEMESIFCDEIEDLRDAQGSIKEDLIEQFQ